jgi:hypothetical protein
MVSFERAPEKAMLSLSFCIIFAARVRPPIEGMVLVPLGVVNVHCCSEARERRMARSSVVKAVEVKMLLLCRYW